MDPKKKSLRTRGVQKEGMVEKLTTSELLLYIPILLVVLVVAFCSLIPLYHVLMSSFSDGKVLLGHSGVLWKPAGQASLDAYRKLFQDTSLLKGYGNTLIYVFGATFFSMLINVTGGYVLSRDTKLKSFLTVFVMITAIFHGGLIPSYVVVKSLGWIGTRWALLIPGCTNAFFVVLMVAGFREIPKETIDAARIDGADDWRLMWSVMLPQAMPMATIIIMNSMIFQWNSWFTASIYITTQRDLWPLQLWIRQLVAENAGFLMSPNADYTSYIVQFALIVIATFPVLMAMPFFIEKMEQSVVLGAVKG